MTEPMPLWPPPASAAPVASAEPRLLSRVELEWFRDAWLHADSCIFTATTEELMVWDSQLYDAIQNGAIDQRASWQIAEAAEAERIAERVAATLAPLLTNSGPEPDESREISGREAQALGLLSRRVFLKAAGEGRFPARKRARGEFVAKLADVKRYADSLRVEPRVSRVKKSETDPVREQIERLLDRGRLRVVKGGR